MRVVDLSAPEKVAAIIRDEILGGELPAGARVKEDAIARRFGVGRHTSRAAIRSLTERRLLVHVRNHGATVPIPHRAYVDEVFDYRTALEISALRLALRADHDFAAVEDAVEALEALPPDAPWRQATETHQKVHRAIVDSAGNQRLADAYSACEDEMQLLFVALRPDFSAPQLAALHRVMFEELKAGGDRATTALDLDIQVNGRETLLHRLSEDSLQARSRT